MTRVDWRRRPGAGGLRSRERIRVPGDEIEIGHLVGDLSGGEIETGKDFVIVRGINPIPA